MDTERVLYFFSVLSRETSGHGEDLSKLFQRALDENDDIITLMNQLEDLAFYNEVGGALKRDGEDIIELAYGAPQQAYEMLPQVSQVSETIRSSLKDSERVMANPYPNSDTVSVLRNSEIPNYIRSLRHIASSVIHLLLVYGGLDAIKDLSWNDTVGILEMLNNVSSRYIRHLMSYQLPGYSWVIRKKSVGGASFFMTDAFFLSFDRKESVDLLCQGYRKERIGTHAFYNVDAYRLSENDVPFCWGTGNIVSTMPNTALDCMKSYFCTNLRAPSETELRKPIPIPFELVRRLSNGREFCISPNELVRAMNWWQSGYDIERNKMTHNCLICGRHMQYSGLVCPHHFRSTL